MHDNGHESAQSGASVSTVRYGSFVPVRETRHRLRHLKMVSFTFNNLRPETDLSRCRQYRRIDHQCISLCRNYQSWLNATLCAFDMRADAIEEGSAGLSINQRLWVNSIQNPSSSFYTWYLATM